MAEKPQQDSRLWSNGYMAVQRQLRGAGATLRRYPPPRAKENPNKMAGGVKSHLESNPIPARDAQRAQTKLVCTRTQRLSQNCVSVSPGEVRVSSGLPQGRGLWVQQSWVWHKPSWRRSPLTPP